MELRRPVVLAATGVLVGALCITGTAQAQPTPTAAPSAQAQAVSAAAGLVATRPAALHASADDVFQAQKAISSTNGLQYIPYERSYKGLPVVGGDFVVATDSAGQVLGTSVAQDQTINLASTTAKVTGAAAEATARQQLSAVDSVSPAQQVVYALGSPALAWKSTVVGRDAEGPSRLDVIVDAATGKVLKTQEHVMNGDGTSAYNRPNPVHLDTTLSGSTYSLKDPNHPTDVLPGRGQQHHVQRPRRRVGQRQRHQPRDRLRRRALRRSRPRTRCSRSGWAATASTATAAAGRSGSA